VVEGSGRISAAVLVMLREGAEGTVARLEDAGTWPERRRVLDWGIRLAQALDARVVQAWRGQGRAIGLAERGLHLVRPFWRMDRPHLEALPEAGLPGGYRLSFEAAPQAWAEVYNRAFSDHWRHVPATAEGMIRRLESSRPRRDLLALGPDGLPAATVWCSLESYLDDPRPQPVALVGVVGTVPEHRRRGLAAALMTEGLRLLRKDGAASAALYVDGLNSTGAADVYRRLGFEVGFRYEVWEHETSPGSW
jgi:ribosomal protein S18 acetylase RimI-like enzyme